MMPTQEIYSFTNAAKQADHLPFDRSVGGTARAILQMEVDLGLLNDETFGPFARLVWEASRFGVHSHLKKRFSGHEVAHTPTESFRQMKALGLVRWSVGILRNTLLHSWFWAPRRREWLIVQHARKRLRSAGLYEDVYTQDLLGEIPEKNRVVLDPPYHWTHYAQEATGIWYTEATIVLCWILRPFLRSRISRDIPTVRRLSKAVNPYLSPVYGEDIDVSPLLLAKASSIRRAVAAHRLMLRWLLPRKIMLVCSYGLEALVSAARSLRIPVVELQHGVVTPEHLGYAVPSGKAKKASPDYILTFGSYWKDTVPWPVDKTRTITLGYPYFERTQAELGHVPKSKSVVIISQGQIGWQLSKFAVRLAKQMNGSVNVVYKLHPGEVARWQKIYPWLVDAQDSGTMSIVDGNEPTLYELLVSAQWQIGVNSTALFEGIGLGCATYLVDLPGIEYMQPLIASGAAQVISEPEDIDWTGTAVEINPDDFFAPRWRESLQQLLKMSLVSRADD